MPSYIKYKALVVHTLWVQILLEATFVPISISTIDTEFKYIYKNICKTSCKLSFVQILKNVQNFLMGVIYLKQKKYLCCIFIPNRK